MTTDEKLDKCLEILTKIQINVGKNTHDISYHIKRTDIIEGKVQKFMYLFYIVCGYSLAEYGPKAIALIKVFL